jgi:hypothetical protein
MWTDWLHLPFSTQPGKTPCELRVISVCFRCDFIFWDFTDFSLISPIFAWFADWVVHFIF